MSTPNAKKTTTTTPKKSSQRPRVMFSLPYKQYHLVKYCYKFGTSTQYCYLIPKDQISLVVVKVFAKVSDRKSMHLNRFLSERSVLAKLSMESGCQFVVKMLETYQTPAKCCLVYDAFSCASLEDIVKCEGYCTEAKCAFIAKQIVLALDFIHAKNIVHRNLCSENVRFGANGLVKIISFENAIQLEMGELSYTELVLMRFNGSAPEMLTAKGHGHEVDWWSFGALLYFLLTGYLLFTEPADRSQKLTAIIACEKVELDWMYGTYGENTVRLLQSLLTVDRAERLGSDGATQVMAHPFFSFNSIDFEDDSYEKIEIAGLTATTYQQLTATELQQYDLESFPVDKVPIKILQFASSKTSFVSPVLDTVLE